MSAHRETLASVLLSSTDQRLLRILDRKGRPEERTWATVAEGASRTAGRLIALGVQRGERVVLVFPTGFDFFDAFFGCMLAGAVPTPVYPPVRLGRMDEYHGRTARMIEAVDARLVLADRRVRRVLGRCNELARPALGVRCLDDLSDAPPATRSVGPEDLAMVQFSSGTTVDPKPVALSHRAVLAQTDALVRELCRDLEDEEARSQVGVSWLPLYHDMGLIGCVFPALRHPGDITLIGPEVFVTRPASWLQALSTYGGTISPAPNFAFALCVSRIEDEEMEGVDLSKWRVALNGAEPVAPEVLRAFTRRFSRWGLRETALTPVYGLSEVSLAVTFSRIDEPFSTRRLQREALAEGRAVLDDEGVEMVNLGRPLEGFEVRIVREREGVADGVVGSVFARGPSLMSGYLGRPELTAGALVDGWLDTGDLGFLLDGELYLTGRDKDVLILRGRNHAPHPLEQALDAVGGVRTGCAAACSYRPEGCDGERLVLFVEHSARATPEQLEVMGRACVDAVVAATALVPDLVVVLEPGTLPRTSSGKIRRGEALRLWRAGELHPPERVHLLRVAGILADSALAYLRAR